MKGTFFNQPLEWNIQTDKESWGQGECIKGTLRLKNHGQDPVDLTGAGVAIAFADIKKVHARTQGAMKTEASATFTEKELAPHAELELTFELKLPENCAVTDKKSSYYLSYGKSHNESHLMLKIEPNPLFTKVIGLLDTFYRFKLKECKSSKSGVEYKLVPPTSRDMANLDSLNLTFALQENSLLMNYDFQVRKLDTSGVVNKVNKESVIILKSLTPREFSLGKDMINQDFLLKSIEGVIGQVKLKSVF
jgi:hypothetical protein